MLRAIPLFSTSLAMTPCFSVDVRMPAIYIIPQERHLLVSYITRLTDFHRNILTKIENMRNVHHFKILKIWLSVWKRFYTSLTNICIALFILYVESSLK